MLIGSGGDMQEDTTKNTGGPSKLSRRTLAAGAAWAVPAIAVAGAAPAYALSGKKPTWTLKDACKFPGRACKAYPFTYALQYEVCNNTNKDIWVYTITYSDTLAGVNFVHKAPPSLPFKVEANKCVTLWFYAVGSGNSANATFDLTLCYTWGHTQTAAGDTEHSQVCNPAVHIDHTRPWGDCACPSA